jgi:hypothetical protein
MISKTDFVRAINAIKSYWANEEKLTKYLHEFFMDGHSVVDFGNELTNTIVKLLAKNISEKHEVSIKDYIEWFIYENDFGKRKLSIYHTLEEGTEKEHKITSTEKMYDYIVKYLRDER